MNSVLAKTRPRSGGRVFGASGASGSSGPARAVAAGTVPNAPAEWIMPFIDSDGQLVVRVVYDGPPMSGKTTTLRSLARRLGSAEVSSPAEASGRTTFFDWTEYVGGLYEGRQIRCQIVSVPGQIELRHRRAFLLESADAVVFVADTRASALPRSLALLEELAPHCRAQKPPLGIVFQANKRDEDEALPTPVLRRMLAAISPTVLVETVATDGDGVREAFVLAVRLALDRVRPLLSRDDASEGRMAAANPKELLEHMLSLERGSHSLGLATRSEAMSLLSQISPTAAAQAAAAMEATFVPGTEAENVFVPNLMMPGGRIWPPVDGRALLHEVTALGLVPVRMSTGDYWAAGGGWWIYSTGKAVFDDLDVARTTLIDSARLHGALASHLSSGRVLILADAGRQRQRLWQLVRVERSLQDRLHAAATAPTAKLIDELYLSASHLLEARAQFAKLGVELACTLATVGADVGRRPIFVGLVSMRPRAAAPQCDEAEFLAKEFGPTLAPLLACREDATDLHHHFEIRASRDVASRVLAELSSPRAASPRRQAV
jgi:signal recognition particle receptor subunit beta